MSKPFPFVVVAILARYETTKRNIMRKEFIRIVHDRHACTIYCTYIAFDVYHISFRCGSSNNYYYI